MDDLIVKAGCTHTEYDRVTSIGLKVGEEDWKKCNKKVGIRSEILAADPVKYGLELSRISWFIRITKQEDNIARFQLEPSETNPHRALEEGGYRINLDPYSPHKTFCFPKYFKISYTSHISFGQTYFHIIPYDGRLISEWSVQISTPFKLYLGIGWNNPAIISLCHASEVLLSNYYISLQNVVDLLITSELYIGLKKLNKHCLIFIIHRLVKHPNTIDMGQDTDPWQIPGHCVGLLFPGFEHLNDYPRLKQRVLEKIAKFFEIMFRYPDGLLNYSIEFIFRASNV